MGDSGMARERRRRAYITAPLEEWSELAIDLARHTPAAVDERRIDLDRRGAGLQHDVGLHTGEHATRGFYGELAMRVVRYFACDANRVAEHWPARQGAAAHAQPRLDYGSRAAQAHALNTHAHARIEHVENPLTVDIRVVWRQLDEHGLLRCDATRQCLHQVCEDAQLIHPLGLGRVGAHQANL